MPQINASPLAEMPWRIYAIHCPPETPNHAYLAGGLDALSGPRSKYFAYLALYDLKANQPVWEFKETKNHPFQNIVAAGGVCAALMPFNFNRTVHGLFLFDQASGEEIARTEIPGIRTVTPLGDKFLAACHGNRLTLIDADGRVVLEKLLPYDEDAEDETGKELHSAIGVTESEFIAGLSYWATNKMAHCVERWSLDRDSPAWTESSCDPKLSPMGEHILCYDDEHRTKKPTDVFSADGRACDRFTLSKGELRSLTPLNDDELVAISPKGTLLVDATTGKTTKLKGDDTSPDDGWTVAAAIPGSRELVVGHVSHFNNPVTRLSRWSL